MRKKDIYLASQEQGIVPETWQDTCDAYRIRIVVFTEEAVNFEFQSVDHDGDNLMAFSIELDELDKLDDDDEVEFEISSDEIEELNGTTNVERAIEKINILNRTF